MGNRSLPILVVAMLGATAVAQAEDSHHAMHMQGALGPYPMSREASGTSWQPEAATMDGIHSMGETWTVMLHGYADVVYDYQGGKRGDEKVFVPSMFMLMGQRAAGDGTLGLRAMLSADPLMGDHGYPLLFQSGETADGVTPLVDRQHPHDLFMELSASYSVPFRKGSAFIYGGLPGEPALGPAAFMHRASGMAIPEAPLSHHWLDSTHVSFGVVTVGMVQGPLKFEASAFNGREPDDERSDIETRGLDSFSGRITLNPTPGSSFQASYGFLSSPELLEPELDLHRSTASYSHVSAKGAWSTTLAVGVNREDGHDHEAWLLESTRHLDRRWTVFGRVEYLEHDHLLPVSEHDRPVAKLSLGGSAGLFCIGKVGLRLGVLGSVFHVPRDLKDDYGKGPGAVMVFLRSEIKG